MGGVLTCETATQIPALNVGEMRQEWDGIVHGVTKVGFSRLALGEHDSVGAKICRAS